MHWAIKYHNNPYVKIGRIRNKLPVIDMLLDTKPPKELPRY